MHLSMWCQYLVRPGGSYGWQLINKTSRRLGGREWRPWRGEQRVGTKRRGHIEDNICSFKGKRRVDWSGWSLWCWGCEHKKGLTHRDAPDDKLSYSFKSPRQQNRWIYHLSPWPGLFRANKNHSSKPVIDFSGVEMAARLFWTFSC